MQFDLMACLGASQTATTVAGAKVEKNTDAEAAGSGIFAALLASLATPAPAIGENGAAAADGDAGGGDAAGTTAKTADAAPTVKTADAAPTVTTADAAPTVTTADAAPTVTTADAAPTAMCVAIESTATCVALAPVAGTNAAVDGGNGQADATADAPAILVGQEFTGFERPETIGAAATPAAPVVVERDPTGLPLYTARHTGFPATAAVKPELFGSNATEVVATGTTEAEHAGEAAKAVADPGAKIQSTIDGSSTVGQQVSVIAGARRPAAAHVAGGSPDSDAGETDAESIVREVTEASQTNAESVDPAPQTEPTDQTGGPQAAAPTPIESAPAAETHVATGGTEQAASVAAPISTTSGPAAAATYQATNGQMPVAAADPDKIQAQVIRAMAAEPFTRDDEQTMTLRLAPEHLGKVEVSVVARGGRLEVVFKAETAEAGKALQDGRTELAQTLGNRADGRWQQVEIRVTGPTDGRAPHADAEDQGKDSEDSENSRDQRREERQQRRERRSRRD